MAQIQSFLTSIGALFTNLFEHPDWHNIVDVAILAILIYNVIKLVLHTRSNSLFKGIAVVLVLAWLSSMLRFSAVSWLLNQIVSMGLVVLVILFQPEFRRGLEQIGRSKFMRRVFGLPGRQQPERIEEDVSEIVRAMSFIARTISVTGRSTCSISCFRKVAPNMRHMSLDRPSWSRPRRNSGWNRITSTRRPMLMIWLSSQETALKRSMLESHAMISTTAMPLNREFERVCMTSFMTL